MKKSISILLVACIILSGILPHTAYANDGDDPIPFVQKDPDTYWSNQDVTLTLTDDDAVDIYYQSKDADEDNWSALVKYNAPLIYSQNGSITINALSKDMNGDTLEEQNDISINIDKTNPTLSVQVNNPVWTRENITISFEADDTFSGVNAICLEDGTVVASVDSNDDDDIFTASYIVSTNGDYTYYAVDNAGNKSSNIQVQVSKIDKNSPTDAPDISASPESASWVTGPVQVTLDWTDNTPAGESQERAQYSDDGSTWEDYVSPLTLSQEGTHTIYARTRDLAGNKSDINQLTIKIDNQAPLLTASGIGSSWTNNDIVVTLNASDTTSGVAGIYSSDGTQLTASSSIERTFTENTESAVIYYAMDNSGKKSDDYPVNISNIDKSAPNAPNISATPSGWSHHNVTIELSEVAAAVNQSPEQRQYNVNDSTWENYESSFEVSQEGEYSVKARTKDEAGNTSSENSATVKIDKTDPTIADVSYTPDSDNQGKGTVSVTISDALSGIYEKKYSIGEKAVSYFDDEGQGIDILDSSFVIDGADGDEYTVYAKDNAGNVTIVNVHDQVASLNTYPLIDDISDKSIDEDAGIQTITITGISDNETTDHNDLDVDYDYSGSILQNVSLVDNDDGTATLTYKPIENKNGEDSITINVTDEHNLTSSVTVKITVNAVDDIPVAVSDTKNANEGDIDIDIAVLGNDSDVEGNVFINNFDVLTAKGGTVEKNIAGDGFVYNPKNSNFSGIDTFTYDVIDETGNISNTTTVTINVQNENDLPIAVDDNHELNEDQTVAIDVLHNDIDEDLAYVDDEILIISIVDYDDSSVIIFDDSDAENPLDPSTSVQVEHGVITYDSDNRDLMFTPDSNYYGSFSFDYTITDMAGESSQATVYISVLSINDEPEFTGLADPPTYTFNEDTATYDIDFSISDVEISDANGLTIRAVSKNTSVLSNSEIEILGPDDEDGATTLRLSPRANVYGTAQIQLELSDGNTITSEILTIEIVNVNDPPVAKNYDIYYTEESYVIFDLDDYKEIDSDIDNAMSELLVTINQDSIDALDEATQGTLVEEDEDEHTYRFTPAENFDENIVLNYTLSDNAGGQDVKQLTLIARPINDSPGITQAATNVYETNEDIPKGILPDDVDTFNIDDYDASDLLVFTISDVDNDAEDLIVTFNSSNEELITAENISYKRVGDKIIAKIIPNLNEPYNISTETSGYSTSIITVNVSDSEIQASSLFSFKVYPQQDNPVAVDDAVDVEYNGFTTILPLENDYDFDGPDIIEIESVGTANGTVSISGDKLSLVYVAQANFKGQDVFTYTISDDKGNTDTGQITVNVGGDNTPPKIDNILDAWDYEDPNPATSVQFNIIDPDTGDLSHDISFEFTSSDTSLIDSDGITYNVDGNGAVTLALQPKANQFGTVNITVKITDELGASDTDIFEYRVYSVNDAPEPVLDEYVVDEDKTTYETNTVIIDPLANDTDVEGDTLSLISISGLANGYLEFLGDDKFKYHPDQHFNDTQVTSPETYSERLTYIVSDGNEQSTGTVLISVEPINDNPRARTDYLIVEGFASSNNSIVLNDESSHDIRRDDYDIEDTIQNTLTWADFEIVKINGTEISVGNPVSTSHGQVSVDASGVLTYTRTEAGEGARETDNFTYTIRDSEGGEGTSIVYIATSYVQSIWVDSKSVVFNEDSGENSITVNYSVPSDVGDYTVSFSQPGTKKGTIPATNGFTIDEVNTTVTFKYTPSLDENGNDSFTFTVSDDDGVYTSKTGNVYIDILPINDEPQFVSWDKTNNDPTNSTVTTTNTTTNPIDSISMQEDTTSDWYTVIFQDNKDWENDDIVGLNNEDLTFELTIGDSASEPVIVENGVEVVRIEDEAGVVVNDNYSAAKFRFTPTGNLSGIVPITIKVSDGVSTVTDTFNLTVAQVNDPPVASDFTETIPEDSTLTEILVNTGSDLEDLDNVTLSISEISSGDTVGSTSKGTIELLNDNKTVVYMPNNDETGTDSFEYTITDQDGMQSTGTVTINITPVNDNPNIIGYQYTYTALEDHNIEINFVAQDVDDISSVLDFERTNVYNADLIKNVTLSKQVVGNQVNMKILVEPQQDKSGSQILNIRVVDDDSPAGYADLEFLVKFEPANDDPVAGDDPSAQDDFLETDEDVAIDIDVLANDSDIDEGSVLHVTEITTPNGFKGTVSINNDNTIKYTPEENYYCPEGEYVTFEYTVSDQFGGEDTATVCIKVASVNDNPVAEDDKATTNEDTPVTIDVLNQGEADSDVEGDELTIVTVGETSEAWHTGGSKAKSIEVSDGKIIYTPADDEYGTDIFYYKISDGNGGEDTAKVTVTIYSVIDDPIPTYDENNSSEFVIYEDILKEYNVHYLNVEDTYKNIIFTVRSSDASILKDTGIVAQKVNKEGASDEDIWIKISFDPVANMNTSSLDPSNIYVYVKKQIGSQEFTDTVPMHVLPVNDSPTIPTINAVLTTAEESSVSGNAVGSDIETQSSDLRYFAGADGSIDVSLSNPYSNMTDNKVTISTANGTVVTNTVTGQYTYTPDENFVGVDSFWVYVDDNHRETADFNISGIAYPRQDSIATTAKLVTVTVTPVNDPPVAVDDSETTDEDVAVEIAVKTNDSDVEDDIDSLDVSVVSNPSNGTVKIVSGGKIEYTPNDDYNGTDTFTYKLKDSGNLFSNTATVTVTIDSVDDSPTAVEDSKIINEDSGYIEITVLNNDKNPDRSDLSDPAYTGITIVSFEDGNGDITSEGRVDNGSVKIENNKLYYKPDLNFEGIEEFNYKIKDSDDDTDTAKVTVTVLQVNDPPVADDDSDTTDEDQPVRIEVKQNDSDVEDSIDDLDIIEVSEPANGTAVVKSDGTIEYTPNDNYNGTDTFTYKLKDTEDLQSNTALVLVTINSVDDVPSAFDDSETISEDSVDSIIAVLNNDKNPDRSDLSDPEYTGLTIVSFEGSNGVITSEGRVDNGYVKIENNKLLYTPDENFVGTETFDYKIMDGDDDTDIAEVVIIITAVNDPPLARNDFDTTDEEQSVRIEVKANDSDVEDANDDLGLIIIDSPANGTAEIKSDGKIKYTPDVNFTGTDTFTYKLEDTGGLTSNLATVTITVNPVSDIPKANDDTLSVPEDSIDFELDVLDNDENPDRSNLSDPPKTGLTIVSFEDENGDEVTQGWVEHGYLKIVDNKLIYTPDHDYEGLETFSYTIEDEDDDKDTADVTLTIVPGEEIPIVTIPDTFSGIYEDQVAPFEVSLDPYVYDQDDGDNWDIIFVNNASNGTADFDQSTKKLTYRPDANFNGMDSISIQVDDGVNKVPAAIKFEIMPVNDAPVGEDNSARADEDTVVIIDVITNDHDIDNDSLLNTHETCVEDVLTILENAISGVDNGTVSIDGDNIVFTPDLNWNGVEIFTYTVKDSAGQTDTAQVEVTIDPVNDGVQVDPNSTFKILEDDENPSSTNILDLVADPEGDPIASFRLISPPAFGTFSMAPDGTITYVPPADFNGQATFLVEFTMDDGTVTTYNVPIKVEPQNDPAKARDDFTTTGKGKPVNIAILVNDEDVDTDEVLNANPFMFDIQVLSQPENGVAEILDPDTGEVVESLIAPANYSRGRYNAFNISNMSLVAKSNKFQAYVTPLASDSLNRINVRYTPNPGFYGTDTFVYGFLDGDGTQVKATVTIEILNDNKSTNQEENPKTGYFIFKKAAEFFGIK